MRTRRRNYRCAKLLECLAGAATTKSNALRFGPVSETTLHLCVDMQRMFAGAPEWQMPWLPRVLPNILAIAEARPSHTIFTRFIPAKELGAGSGMWKHYYERWHMMTLEKLGEEMIDLVPELARFVPPARVFDKYVYSPWTAVPSISICRRPASTLSSSPAVNRRMRAFHSVGSDQLGISSDPCDGCPMQLRR